MHPKSITLPKKAINLMGQTFNRLTAITPVEIRDKSVVWLCRCECGNQTRVKASALRKGHVRSCGCTRRDRVVHGMHSTAIYAVWAQLVYRCTNPQATWYESYGARGITCCPEWHDSFETFHAHVSQLDHYGKKGYSLDRIDNERGYEPGNVRWATAKAQGRNRRDNHLVTYGGLTLTITEWAERLGINSRTLYARLTLMKWDIERAFTTPVRTRRKPR